MTEQEHENLTFQLGEAIKRLIAEVGALREALAAKGALTPAELDPRRAELYAALRVQPQTEDQAIAAFLRSLERDA